MVSQHDCHSLKTRWKIREFEGVQGKNFVVVFKGGLGTEGFRLGLHQGLRHVANACMNDASQVEAAKLRYAATRLEHLRLHTSSTSHALGRQLVFNRY